MKQLFILILVLMVGVIAKGQSPFGTPNYLFGSKSKITQNQGGFRSDSGFIVAPRFTDTATANLSVVSLYGGMLIRVVDTLWLRNETATRWNKMGGTISSGGGGSGTVESFSAGNLANFFVTSVGDPTVNPNLTFALIQQGGGKYFGTPTGGNATPSFLDLDSALSTLIGVGGTNTLYVVLDSTNTPPGSPSLDDAYMVGGAPTGAWVGQAYKIATWDGGAWVFTTPAQGDNAYTTDDFRSYVYTGSTWQRISGIPVLVEGNRLGTQLRMGTNDAFPVRLKTNNTNRLSIAGNGDMTFNKLTGSGDALTALSSTGAVSRASVAARLSLSGGTLDVATNGITDAYLRQSAGLSVIGNSTNATANVADITAGTDHYVLRRSGTSLGFGTLNAAAMNPTYTNGYTLQTDGSGNLSWVAGSAGGITDLNGLTASTQTFATGTSGSDFNISSATSTHTFNIPDAGASARGLVTTGTQTFAGAKTFSNNSFNLSASLTGGGATDNILVLNTGTGAVGQVSSSVYTPWLRAALSGAAATTNIVQPKTIADTIVTGGVDVIGTTTSPLYKFNHSGNMGVFRNGIGTSIIFGNVESIIARNTTAAALGAQQNSGMIALIGNAWNTTSSASQPVTFGLQTEPVQGGTVDGNLKIKRSLNGANYSDVATFSAGGNLTTSGANIYIGPAFNGTLNASTFYSATGINQVLQTQSSGNTWSVVQGGNRPLNLYATTSNLIVTGGGVGTAPTDPSANFSVYRGAGAPINLHTVTSGSATVSGGGTFFTNTFRPGDNITISGTTRVVQSVNSNTNITTTATWPSNVSNAGATTDARYAMVVRANGQVGIFGISTPTASLHIGAGITAAQGAPIKLTTGSFMTTAEAGAMEYTTPQLTFTNGTAIRQEIPLIQQTRVSTQFDKTSDVTLANVTGLTADLAAGATYRFEAILYTSSANTGGVKFAIGGTATATNIIYEAVVIDNNVNAAQTRATALATAVGGVTAVTAAYCKITGTITVNAAGTLTLQFAQNNSDGTASSVLVGSTFVVTQIL